MKKVKKLVTVAFCFIFMVALIGSCSSDSGETKEIVTTGNGEVAIGVTDDTNNVARQTTAVSIVEQVLLDQNGIVITAKEYVSDSIWGDGIKLLLENNSDKTVTVSCNALIVNNYMLTDFFVSEVAAGKKANETMYLSSSELKAAGIESVGQVEVYFRVYDSNSYDTIFETDCITIQTSEYANMDITPKDAGTELYNAGGIRIVGKAVDENSFWGMGILLYCENSSGRNIGIRVEEMSVNGFMITPFFSTTLYNGKMSIDDITILSSDLETNGITNIEEAELKFHIYDADSYNTIADSDAITFLAQ